MKWFEYEYSIGNNPDTHVIYIQGESDEEIAEILSRYSGDEISADELFECDAKTVKRLEHDYRFGRNKNIMKVVRGELV